MGTNPFLLALLSLLPGAALAATPAAGQVRIHLPVAAHVITQDWSKLLPDENSPLASCELLPCGEEKPPVRLHYWLLGYTPEKPEEMVRELTSRLNEPVVTTAADWLTRKRIGFDLDGGHFVVAFRLRSP